MARTPGTFNIYSNYDVGVKKPFDARMLVPTYADLTIKSNWQIVETDDAGATKTTFIAYNGMLVAVADKNDVANSGLYMLFDIGSGKNPNVEEPNNWIKIGETSDISDLVTRVASIESELKSFDERLDTLEADKPEVFGYRSLFPTSGVEGKLYIAVDEQKTYVWVDSRGYLCIGEENKDPEIDIIYGGDSGI